MIEKVSKEDVQSSHDPIALEIDATPDHAVSAVERVAKYGITLTTLVTVYLFLVGYSYWSGYFAPYHVDAWAIDIPFFRYLIPSQATFSVWSNGIVVYLLLLSGSRAAKPRQKVEELGKGLFTRLGLSEEYILKNARYIGAYTKADKKHDLQWSLIAYFAKDEGKSFQTLTNDDLASVDKEAFIERLNLPTDLAKRVDGLTPEAYYGLRYNLLFIRAVASKDGSFEKWDKGAEEFQKARKEFEKLYGPGRVERFVTTGWSLLWVIAFIVMVVKGIPFLANTILGSILGAVVFAVPRFLKSLPLQYMLLILAGAVTLIHAEGQGEKDSDNTRTVYVLTKEASEEKEFARVFESPKGLYVLETDKKKPEMESLRMIPWSEVKSLRYQKRSAKK